MNSWLDHISLATNNHCLVITVIIVYHIAGFYHKDFNIAFGSIRNIKICVIFVKRNILCKCPTVIPASFFKQLYIDPP